ncbi:16S rRNA (guanine(966)-N(2))-methyltransferase RsmD [Mycoplasma cottewii]|uniref:16S rRNA (Guanine(966)-N(2))-methyltransferase RsmD n=1 Tax=Mycoplasma cottewii TaxID=51364 RepID=A0ABY5TXT3_9MOLU|nr:16S rRNA (guanine(966)-N(2))-methyltransferase RsmD [Mycoplasma cottewii]UWD34831.1 16S rRNA (guanine(966)-N(2))-methyltransferase RsmD [Mycoplasma cottewii]
MHIIAGKYKKMKLKTLDSRQTRPTLTRIKEDMFNILNNYFIFENKTSLDLFAGSGSLSIEALSWGVRYAIINDNSKHAIEIIKQNLSRIDKSDYVLYQNDYLQLLELLKVMNQKVDLVFLDPPFAHENYMDYYYEIINYLIDNNILNPWAIIVCEAGEKLDLEKLSKLELLRFKDCKNKFLYFLRWGEE